MIVHRKKEGIEAALDAAGVRENPVRVLNDVLLPAMKEVGDKFGAGELILPFVLQSAEVMKKAVKHLEQFLEKRRRLHQGQGRARDGVRRRARHRQVARQHDPLQQRLHRVRPRQAGAGEHDHRQGARGRTPTRSACRRCSCSTSKQMPLCVQELDQRGMQIPVLIGGAAINRRFGRRALFVEGERAYDAGRVLLQGRVRGAGDDGRAPGRRRRATQFVARAARRRAQRRVPAHAPSARTSRPAIERRRSAATSRADNPVPRAPFFGTRVLRRHSARRGVRRCSTSTSCIACSGAGAARAPEYERDGARGVRADARAAQGVGEARRLAQAAAVYGYFPAQSVGQRPHRLRSRARTRRDGTLARDRALPLPAAGRPRAAVPRRLLPLDVESATWTSSRSRS